MNQYDFDQMLAEAVAKIGRDPVQRCVETFAKEYGWPIPVDKRATVVTAVVCLVTESSGHKPMNWTRQ